MRRVLAPAAGAMLATGLFACTTGSPEPITAPTTLPLRSSSFDHLQAIPADHTCAGADVSPALFWTIPPAVTEYALTVTDLDAGGFVHWILYGMPPETAGLASGALSPGAHEGTNDFGDQAYGGPCPPPGSGPHRYEFRLYALSSPVGRGLRDGLTLDQVLDAIRCCVQSTGLLVGTYERT